MPCFQGKVVFGCYSYRGEKCVPLMRRQTFSQKNQPSQVELQGTSKLDLHWKFRYILKRPYNYMYKISGFSNVRIGADLSKINFQHGLFFLRVVRSEFKHGGGSLT